MPLSLRVLGLCGADDSVAPELLALLSQKYPWIEWGVLFRPDLEGQPRYASFDWVERLVAVNRKNNGVMKLAGHLCAERCQQVLDGDASFSKKLHELGFGRIQINATAANKVIVDGAKLDVYANNIRSCILAVPEIDFIFQLNDETRGIWNCIIQYPIPSNLNVLFDASCGLGVLAKEYPSPLVDPVEIPCGYAGGIGPSNIADVLSAVETAANGKTVWVDMESSLRVLITDKHQTCATDAFSIDKCFQCVLVAAHLF